MFSLTRDEQTQVITACAGVLDARRRIDSAVFKEDDGMYGMEKARLQSQIARLFAVVDAIESKEASHGEETEPPF